MEQYTTGVNTIFGLEHTTLCFHPWTTDLISPEQAALKTTDVVINKLNYIYLCMSSCGIGTPESSLSKRRATINVIAMTHLVVREERQLPMHLGTILLTILIRFRRQSMAAEAAIISQ